MRGAGAKNQGAENEGGGGGGGGQRMRSGGRGLRMTQHLVHGWR